MQINKSNYYDPEKGRTSWIRIAIIIGIIIVIFAVIILLIKVFQKSPDLYSNMVSSLKNASSDVLPVSIGECKDITLSDMKKNNILSKSNQYKKCNETDTYVKVCKIDEKDYQYTPVLSCGKTITQFGEWQDGELSDLKQGNSDIKIMFFGEESKLGIKNYYPDNLTDVNKVSNYYAISPATDYILKDKPTVGYKWYTEKQGAIYYNNGEFVSSEPDGYSTKGEEKTNTYISIKSLSNTDYRTSKSITVYAKETVAYPYKYECVDSSIPGTITTSVSCENRNANSHKITSKVYYTCNGTTAVSSGTVCSKRSGWTSSSCLNGDFTSSGTTSDGYQYKRKDSTGLTCVYTNGYLVTDKSWKWYKTDTIKTYYPSGTNDGSKENAYFIKSPIAGGIKDEDSKSNVYQFYKLVVDGNTSSWISIVDDVMDEDDLINKFSELGYSVSSLKDIEDNDKIQYQIKITYRDRK